MIGRVSPNKGKKGGIPWNKGKTNLEFPNEYKQNMSLVHIGKKHSEAICNY
jgi:hypothetical protein